MIGNGVVLDLKPFVELDQLRERGIDTTGRILGLGPGHLVCRTTSCSMPPASAAKLGTTGRGSVPAYEYKYGRRGIRSLIFAVSNAPSLMADRVARANQLLEMMGSSERAKLDSMCVAGAVGAPGCSPLLRHRSPFSSGDPRREAGAAGGCPGRSVDVDHGRTLCDVLQHHGRWAASERE